METEQLEQQLPLGNRFMYMALGSSVTLALISYGNYLNGSRWPDFDSYAGELWQWMQITTTPPGFYLLRGQHWKRLPFSIRRNTILGFFLASWITFLSFGFITTNEALFDFDTFLILCALLIAAAYIWMVKKKSNRPEEMFP